VDTGMTRSMFLKVSTDTLRTKNISFYFTFAENTVNINEEYYVQV
jgi:hypothetical protein